MLKPVESLLSRPFGGGHCRRICRSASAGEPGQGCKTKKLIREHEVEVDHESGLVSVLGGKWTTYRAMAEDAVKRCSSNSDCRWENASRGDIDLSGSEATASIIPNT